MSNLEQLAEQLANIYRRCEGCRHLLETPCHGLPFCGYQLATGRQIPDYNVEECPCYTKKKEEKESVKLTPEERDKVIQLISSGKSNKEIAEELGVPTKTVAMTRVVLYRTKQDPAESEVPPKSEPQQEVPPKLEDTSPKLPVSLEVMVWQIQRAAETITDMGAELIEMSYNIGELSAIVYGTTRHTDIKIRLTITPK